MEVVRMQDPMINYGRHNIEPEDIESVMSVLKSDHLTQGPKVESFEKALMELTGAKHAVTVSNASVGLYMACRALSIGSSDRLWTTANSFVASASCGTLCGAEVDFVDIDPNSFNMCLKAFENKIRKASKPPTLVVVVHFAGRPVEMKRLFELKKEFGFFIIEDAAHAIGSHYEGLPVGAGVYSDATVFSFHPVKNVTTAEGGAVLTNKDTTAHRLRALRTVGVSRQTQRTEKEPWAYDVLEPSLNFRLSDLQCSLGLSQLNRISTFFKRREEIFQEYSEELSNLSSVRLPPPSSRVLWHLYPIRVNWSEAGLSKLDFYKFMMSQGVRLNVHYQPIYQHSLYADKNLSDDYCPEAQNYYQSAFSLPIFYSLSATEQKWVIKSIKERLP